MAHLQSLDRTCTVSLLLYVDWGRHGGVQRAGEEQFCRWSEQWGSWQLPSLKEEPTAAVSCTIEAIEKAAVCRITVNLQVLIFLYWLQYILLVR